MLNGRWIIGRQLTSDSADTRLGSILAYVAGVLIPIFAVIGLAKLDPTEKELLFGLLLAVIASLLCVLLGLTITIHGVLRAKADAD